MMVPVRRKGRGSGPAATSGRQGHYLMSESPGRLIASPEVSASLDALPVGQQQESESLTRVPLQVESRAVAPPRAWAAFKSAPRLQVAQVILLNIEHDITQYTIDIELCFSNLKYCL